MAQPGAPAGSVGAGWETYRFANASAAGIRTVSLLTLPWGVRAPLGRGVTLDVSGAYARGSLTREDGTTATLGGLTDTQVRLARTFGRDRVTLALAGSIPTGHSRNTPGQAEVANAVSADLLPFRISNWGTGGGVGLSAAVAQRWRGFGIGASGGYTVARSYEPFSETDGGTLAYRPGDEARLRVAADHGVGRSSKAALQVTWQHFDTDRFGGANLYRAGDRLQAVASLQGVLGGYNAVAWGGLLHRGHGTSLDARSPGAPVQDLWLGGAGLRVPYGRAAVTWGADGRLFRVADGQGQGWYAGIGGTGEVPAGRLTLLPAAHLRLGRVVAAADRRSAVRGVDLGLSLRRSW
ncbi:MAG: hypothetical protein JWM27_2666 [Gemmatimonadetes bacterium]|nr:hypothetical protein [Gemmatimonadota bacterium]